jgi:hypothetical protein
MFTVCWLAVPILAVLALSVAYRPMLVLRYLVICLLPATVLVAAGVTRLLVRRPAVGAGLLAMLVAVSGVGLWRWYGYGTSEDWKSAAGYISARSAPGDGVVLFAPYMRIPFEWYLEGRPGLAQRLHPVFPDLGWGIDPLRYDFSIPIQPAAITAAARQSGRVWVIVSQARLYPTQERSIVQAVQAADLTPAPGRHFPGIDVVLYRRVPSPG